MIDWLIRLLRRNRDHEFIEVKLTDPAEKRKAEQRAIENQARVQVLEDTARTLSRSQQRS